MNVENVDDLVQRISQLRLQELLATQVLWDADRTRRTSAQAVTSLSRSVSRFYISGNTWSKKFSVLALVLTKEV